jgi:hypothetical protein
MAQTTNDSTTEDSEINVGHFRIMVMSFDAVKPSATPINPPTILISIGLDEKLQQYINTSCADRHPQTNFFCSLRNRYIHDIHDADATNNQ